MELIPSSGGVFEVSVNGENIYSKREVGKFPKAESIISTIEEM
jgi:selenoprotein W-related protein